MLFCFKQLWGGISACFFLGLMLAGCASLDDCQTLSPQRATSRPYQIKGIWYYPQQHYELEETGVASYYGGVDGCHGLPTATGEAFDMYQLTAAHKVLPLPSVVLVTNLENGRMLKLKVNDRGPFKNNRVLDVSVRAAKLLGFYEKGTAMVQIQALTEESLCLPENIRALARQEARGNGVQLATRSPRKKPPVLLASNPANPAKLARAASSSSLPSFVSTATTVSPRTPPSPHSDTLIQQSPPASHSIEAVLHRSLSAKDPALETAGIKAKTTHPTLYIQVKTHALLLDAQKDRRALPVSRNNAFIKKQTTRHGALYRVMLGPFKHIGEADALLDTLIKQGYTQSRLSIER
jgi:rare lipoprotein A